MARVTKENDKTEAKASIDNVAACFDLQQVITLPHDKTSSLYYTRRLNNFNLTVYSLGTQEGYAYLWNESVANRGSNEIASCVLKFLETIFSNGIKSVALYSDNCSGQNRNRYFLCMLWYAMKRFAFTRIEHKFLERGHTFNDNDWMHSTIETALKRYSLRDIPASNCN